MKLHRELLEKQYHMKFVKPRDLKWCQKFRIIFNKRIFTGSLQNLQMVERKLIKKVLKRYNF